MVALLKMLKRLGARNSNSDSHLFQSDEANASGVDACCVLDGTRPLHFVSDSTSKNVKHMCENLLVSHSLPCNCIMLPPPDTFPNMLQ